MRKEDVFPDFEHAIEDIDEHRYPIQLTPNAKDGISKLVHTMHMEYVRLDRLPEKVAELHNLDVRFSKDSPTNTVPLSFRDYDIVKTAPQTYKSPEQFFEYGAWNVILDQGFDIAVEGQRPTLQTSASSFKGKKERFGVIKKVARTLNTRVNL